MAGAKKKINDKHAQKTNFNLLIIIAWGLATIGKPFYFIFSRIFIGIIFVLYSLGHTLRIVTNNVLKSLKTKGRKRKKTRKSKKTKRPEINLILPKITLPVFKFPVIRLPVFKFPKLARFFKLEWLRVIIFELSLWEKIKRSGNLLKKLFKNRRTTLRIRTFTPLFIIILFIFGFYFFILRGLPSPKELISRDQQVSTKIYDRNGILLYKIYKDKNRTIVPLTGIPLNVRMATLAAEDAEFYSHPGFSLKGILRAAVEDIRSGSLQGGSTITQQLVKNTLLSPEKTILRKVKEIVLSVEVEATFGKDQILEMYLNEVSYGGTAYGIQEASESYFGKNVKDLSLAEAAFLAGLPKSPTLFSPFGQSPESAFARQKEVLKLMRINKYITEEQEQAAENDKISFVPNRTEIKAPHFVMYIRQLLVDKYGEDMVEKGGLEVTTSLDENIQEAAEKIVKTEVEKLSGLNVGNGAAMVLNPQTGEILAMVGSKDYFNLKNDGNVNVLTSLRQPGSSIKLINYAYALGHGYTPASIIDDSPIKYSIPGSPVYSPQNYDGQFKGNVTLRSALAQSRNIPAVKILASYGVPKMIDLAQKMGITTWTDTSRYGLSLTLGGGAVKAIDLVRAYATVADYGEKPDLLPILSVKDYKGTTLETDEPAPKEHILDPRVAYTLIDILKDNNARAPEFGFNSSLVVKDHPEVAVKTGTSNDLRDNWTVGFNQNYLVLAWVGNNDNSPMNRIASGITGAAPIWNQIMSTILNGQASIDWKVPDNMSKVNICAITGTLPCDSCPTRQEWFLDENKPTKACSSDQIQKIINPTPQTQGGKILDNGASTVYR